MLFLKWYSVVMVTFSIGSIFLNLVGNNSSNVDVDVWAILLYAPVVVFLWITAFKKEKSNV